LSGKFVNTIIKQLKLEENLSSEINLFLLNVSFYRIAPYVDFISKNKETFEYIKEKTNGIISNEWEAVVYLYRYNIKLSISIYPYIFLLETILKTRINNKLTEKYTDYWFRDEALFLKAYEITNATDLSIYNKYKNIDITEQVENNIYEDYYLINDQLERLEKDKLSNNKIKTKIQYIKKCGYIYRGKQEALINNSAITCMDFVENKVMLGYWLSILSIKNLWENSEGVFLKNIFSKLPEPITKKVINKKLESIRILRNKIAHHAQIVGKNHIKNTREEKVSLIDVYKDMKDIFEYLDVNLDGNFEIMELKCNKHLNCSKRSFEILYDELAQIHEYEILPAKTERKISLIEMKEVESSNMKKLGYDEKERIFQVEFNKGEIYQYYNVPNFLYEKIKSNEVKSKGKFFIKNIRDNFKYKKIN